MTKAVLLRQADDDAPLIVGALNRDRDAIAALTQRYNRRLFRIARSILKSDDEAEDAVQATYLRAFTHLATFRHESSFGTWLTRIAINVALGHARSKRATPTLVEIDEASRPGIVVPFPLNASVDPERSVAQRQISAVLEEAIDELSENFRTVLVARVLEGMSVDETAELLAIAPQTVKTRLHRARRMLRAAVERRVGPLLMDAFPFDGWRCKRMTTLVLRALGLDA